MARNKLSQAQQKVLDRAKEHITLARTSSTYEEHFLKYEASHKNCDWNTPEKYKAQDPEGWKYYQTCWEQATQGVVLTHCSTPTLLKLEKLGYIKILENSNGERYGIDLIQVLNF